MCDDYSYVSRARETARGGLRKFRATGEKLFVATLTDTGSPGHESSKLGPKTKAALIKFQKAHGILPATGRFGPRTRAYFNQHP